METEAGKAIQYRLTQEMKETKGLKFVETVRITFEKMSRDGVSNETAYFNSAPKTEMNVYVLEDDLITSIKRFKTRTQHGYLRALDGQSNLSMDIG